MAPSLVIHDLRCGYLTNPLGIGESRPLLSWKLSPATGKEEERGLAQSAYQILVASSRDVLESGKPDLWDSGRVASNRTVFVDYAGKPLASAARAWWTVRIWDQARAPSALAAPQFWEMGLLDKGKWTGRWIACTLVGGPQTSIPAPYFRKPFAISRQPIISARLYATALGLYEFHLNGQRIGCDLFTPGCTDYRKRVQYQAYDVAEYLRPGENVIGAILGDGWYCGFMGNSVMRQFYGDRPKILAQLVVTFADGSVQTISTDSSWKFSAGPILANDFMMGESYDARLEMPNWNAPGSFDDNRWQPAVEVPDPGVAITAMSGPPVRRMLELKPIDIKQRHNRWWLIDFGQNMVGNVRLRMKGKAGVTVRMTFVEMLDKNGGPYTANLRQAKQTDYYTLRGDPDGETYEPRFTFHGFRYVEIDHYPGQLTAGDIVAVVIHSDMEQTGSFECSEPLVNQLQKNIQWGQRGNFVDIPTDCPQRDERLGWTGDAQVFCRTAAFNFDVAGFFAKWTADMRDAQTERGSYPWIIPNTEAPRKDEPEWGSDGGPAWADAGVICPWTMWLVHGDVRLVERHYASMCKFVDYLKQSTDPFHLIRSHPEWKGFHGFGDWLSQDSRDGLMGGTPKDLIGTAFTAYDARLLAQIAAALGREKDVAKYTQLVSDVTAAFCRRFVTADGLIVANTQTACVLALHFDLLPPEKRPAVLEALVRNIRNDGTRLNTGFVGSPYLNFVLTRFGKLDVAYELLMQTKWPSWLYAVTQGATTIWERWDGWTHDKGFQDAGMNSFNHYAYGAIGAWLYQIVAGLDVDPNRPGYEHIIFHPHPQRNGPLMHAQAKLESNRGPIESVWRLKTDGCTLQYEISIPPNLTATAHIPAADPAAVLESGKSPKSAVGIKALPPSTTHAIFELTSGRYTFTSIL